MNPLIDFSPRNTSLVPGEENANVWILCNSKLYAMGEYRRCGLKNPLIDRIKTIGREVKLPRLFDLCEIEIATTNYQSMTVMAALTASRDVSIGLEIKYPDDSSVGIVLNEVFAGQFFPDIEYSPGSVPKALLKLQLFAKDNTNIHWTNEPPFNKQNENFRLTHPLLQLVDCIKEFTDRETQPRRRDAPAIQKTTDMLHLGYNPHRKGSK